MTHLFYCHILHRQQEGDVFLEFLIHILISDLVPFMISVLAGILSNYIYNKLTEHKRDNKE